MEIKRINGVITSYTSQKVSAPNKTDASASAKKTDRTDRIEFGFADALTAARGGIAQDIKTDATPQELLEAQRFAEEGVDPAELAGYILMG